MGKENLNSEQAMYFDIVMGGSNAFITGGGGAGKSHLIREIIEAKEENGK